MGEPPHPGSDRVPGPGLGTRHGCRRALGHRGETDWTLALYRQVGEEGGQGHALASLAECNARMGNYDLARGYARQALQAAPATGDPSTLAFAWDALGFVHSRLGKPRQAMSCYR